MNDRLVPVQENPWKDPRFIIAVALIVGFGVAYAFKPSETMNGALINQLSIAVGYWLGSSSGAREGRSIIANAQEQTSQAIALVDKQTPSQDKPDVVVQPGDKVTIAGGDGEGGPVAAPPKPASPPEHPPWA